MYFLGRYQLYSIFLRCILCLIIFGTRHADMLTDPARNPGSHYAVMIFECMHSTFIYVQYIGLYLWISTTHQSFAMVRLCPGLNLEPLSSQLNWASRVGLGKEAQGVQGHLQLWGSAYKYCPNRLGIRQPYKPHLDYLTLCEWMLRVSFMMSTYIHALSADAQKESNAPHKRLAKI